MTETKTGPIKLGMVINEVIRVYPQVRGVFNRFNIDSYDSGTDTIAIGAVKAGEDPEEVVAALNEALRTVHR